MTNILVILILMCKDSFLHLLSNIMLRDKDLVIIFSIMTSYKIVTLIKLEIKYYICYSKNKTKNEVPSNAELEACSCIEAILLCLLSI